MIYKKKERKYFYGFVICYRLIITSAKNVEEHYDT